MRKRNEMREAKRGKEEDKKMERGESKKDRTLDIIRQGSYTFLT